MTPDPGHLLDTPPAAAPGRELRPSAADWLGYPELGSARLLRLMAFLSLRLGRGAARIVLYGIALYFFLFSPAALRHSGDYLRLALGRRPRARERFRHVLYFATCIHDRVYLVNRQFERFEFSIEGEALMRARFEAGGGAFLMGAHLGSFEAIGSIGRRQPGLEISMAMYERNAQKINGLISAINPEAVADIIPLGRIDTMLSIAERLDGGGFVGVLGDRTLGGEPTHRVRLLGRAASLPTGPMRAAAILRRPVIFMAGLYRGANRYHVIFEQIADFSATPAGEREAAVRRALERYAALLERLCRTDPYNWFNFFDFWREPGDRPSA